MFWSFFKSDFNFKHEIFIFLCIPFWYCVLCQVKGSMKQKTRTSKERKIKLRWFDTFSYLNVILHVGGRLNRENMKMLFFSLFKHGDCSLLLKIYFLLKKVKTPLTLPSTISDMQNNFVPAVLLLSYHCMTFNKNFYFFCIYINNNWICVVLCVCVLRHLWKIFLQEHFLIFRMSFHNIHLHSKISMGTKWNYKWKI